MKPENVLIDLQGYIRITDFGLSKMQVKTDHDAISMCGTPEYLAPEILNKKGYGKSVDWWTLGCIIIEMFTGYPPFHAPNRNLLFDKIKNGLTKIPKNASPELADLLNKLLERDPKKRLGFSSIIILDGAKEVMEHKWFKNLNWEGILKKSVKSPFMPQIKND